MSASRVSDNVFINTNGQLATYTNENSNNYLTPTSPITPQPPHIFPSRTLPISQTKLPNGEPMQRIDSGIETDSQRSPTPSTSTANPRLSAAVYEYINPKDVYLEPTANPNNRARPGESSAPQIPTRAATSPEYVTSDSEDAGGSEDSYRRRFNPVYEALEKSATRLYAQTCHCKLQATTQRQLRYLWCIQTHRVSQDDRLKNLETRFAGYYRAETAGEPKLEVVFGVISELNVSVNSLESQLMAVNASLQDQLQNISLTPGPQGPAGAGDLNQCYYKNVTSNQALPGLYSTTSWQPALDVLENNIVMSAACGVIGGDQQFVETNAISSNKVQFRCRCDGAVDGYQYRECRLHLIVCPRTSST
ncbi:hypothetical protein BaRGS_00020337 [Batillaria attramentaria]|uniref:Uncharacterized protein n=1 Tax=Batillaria attramentaria TaxID=370345 RepID=A0ABD0KM67_9CAEN